MSRSGSADLRNVFSEYLLDATKHASVCCVQPLIIAPHRSTEGSRGNRHLTVFWTFPTSPDDPKHCHFLPIAEQTMSVFSVHVTPDSIDTGHQVEFFDSARG